jgi:peptide/nickel transport system permease protein
VSARVSDSEESFRAIPPTRGLSLWRRLRREPLGLLGLVLVAVVLLGGLFADHLTPYDPLRIAIQQRLLGPSPGHLLGTDQLGRDVLSRVIKGSQIALVVGVSTIAVAQLFGLTLGLLAGYGPRSLDNALMLLFDTVRSFPMVMLALAVITLVGTSLSSLMLIITVTQCPTYARLVRTSTLSIKHSAFIEAERSLGIGPGAILLGHILPNVVGPLLIIGSMDIPTVVTLEAGLSFLGLGIPPPAPSWGRILNDGYNFIREAPWIALAGGLPLVITTIGFTFLGEALRDFLDPRLRRIL